MNDHLSGNKSEQVKAPILVIDSGLGGVSILNALQKKLPNENFIYFADYAFLPYGEKSEDVIKTRCIDIVNALDNEKPKAVVLACNSATASAISSLRKTFKLEFFGTEPGIKPAAKESKLGIAVLATALTLNSEQFAKLIKQYASTAPVFPLAAPELVTLVESGEWQSEAAEKVIQNVLNKAKGDFDTLLLGCTHFSFLTEQLQKLLGERVKIIDTSDAIATRVFNKLDEKTLLQVEVKGPTLLGLRYSARQEQEVLIEKKLSLLKSSISKSFNLNSINKL